MKMRITPVARATASACLISASSLGAQQPAPSSSAIAPSATYMERYREVMNLAPLPGQAADVNHLVLTRDAGQLILEQGKVYLLSPVGGRTVGAVFRGEGRFTFTPPLPAEQAELQRVAGASALDDTVSEVILLFADSTAEQLRALISGPAEVPGDLGDHVRDLVGSLKGDNEGSFSDDVIGPWLNGESNGLFLARLERAHGGPVRFELDPAMTEAVRLYRPVSKLRWGSNWAVVTQFPLQHPLAGTAGTWAYRERLLVPAYRMDVSLKSTTSANLDFAAQTTLTLTPTEPVGPWLLWRLHPKLVVDSARWGSGAAAPVFKAKDGDDLWVRAERQLQVGDSLSLTIFYQGEH